VEIFLKSLRWSFVLDRGEGKEDPNAHDAKVFSRTRGTRSLVTKRPGAGKKKQGRGKKKRVR